MEMIIERYILYITDMTTPILRRVVKLELMTRPIIGGVSIIALAGHAS